MKRTTIVKLASHLKHECCPVGMGPDKITCHYALLPDGCAKCWTEHLEGLEIVQEDGGKS